MLQRAMQSWQLSAKEQRATADDEAMEGGNSTTLSADQYSANATSSQTYSTANDVLPYQLQEYMHQWWLASSSTGSYGSSDLLAQAAMTTSVQALQQKVLIQQTGSISAMSAPPAQHSASTNHASISQGLPATSASSNTTSSAAAASVANASSAPLGQQLDEDPPEHFCCPITLQIMNDPVITSDGSTYERPAIIEWLQTHDTSPLTGVTLDRNVLIPNRALKEAIAACKAIRR
eukprot:jgi/Chrzof1/15079/Cz09g26130.t1